MAVCIITDSTSEITPAKAKELNIEIVPMIINFENQTFLDGVTITNKEFYERLRTSNKLPKTSLINSETFAASFDKYSDKDDVIGIFVSSELSGSYQSSLIAKENFPNKKIHLIDSMQVSFGLAALVLYAIRLRDEGKKAKEIVELIEEAKKRLVVFAIIDDLKYLKLGGRLSSSSFFIGSLIKLKPIIRVKDGKVQPVHKTLGTHLAFSWLVEQYKSFDVDETKPRLFGHSDDEEGLSKFMDYVKKKIDFPIELVFPIGPTVGVHAGPGAVGFAFFIK